MLRLLQRLGLTQPEDGRRLVLITAHRRENFGAPLENVFTAIRCLAEIYGEGVQFIYPVHLNPNVQEPAYRLLSGVSNITLLPPVDYLPIVHLIKHSTLVLTDSGGIQEEAPGLGVPVSGASPSHRASRGRRGRHSAPGGDGSG